MNDLLYFEGMRWISYRMLPRWITITYIPFTWNLRPMDFGEEESLVKEKFSVNSIEVQRILSYYLL